MEHKHSKDRKDKDNDRYTEKDKDRRNQECRRIKNLTVKLSARPQRNVVLAKSVCRHLGRMGGCWLVDVKTDSADDISHASSLFSDIFSHLWPLFAVNTV